MSETPEDTVTVDPEEKSLVLYARKAGAPIEIGGVVLTNTSEGTLIQGFINKSPEGSEFTALLMSGIVGGLTLGAAADGSKLPKIN